jgi:hypothetical protein
LIVTSLVGRCEFSDQLVAALNDSVKRLFRVLLACQQRLEFLVDDLADLNVVAEAKTLGIRSRRIERHLLDGDIRARILGVVALLLAEFIGCLGDRQVTGELVPIGLTTDN